MGAVRHECPSPSLPDAWEHEFPLNEINGNHVLASVIDVIGRDHASVETTFVRRLSGLKTPEVREFAYLLDGMRPCSVMVQGKKCWLVLKTAEHASSRTKYGNAILVPALPQRLKWPAEMAADFGKADFLLEFFEQFDGLSLHVPPAGYCASCNDELQPMCEDSFPGLGQWQGSLPVFYPGDGDVMLARPDGSTGVWQHEFSSSYDQSAGLGFSLLLKSLQLFLPSAPESGTLPPDCVAKRENSILVELREEIEWMMARA